MFKYYIFKGFNIQAGPQLGFLLSAENEVEGDNIDIDEITNSVDFGFILGLGYQLLSSIFFEARYNIGLSEVFEVEGTEIDSKNGVFQISVGYKF